MLPGDGLYTRSSLLRHQDAGAVTHFGAIDTKHVSSQLASSPGTGITSTSEQYTPLFNLLVFHSHQSVPVPFQDSTHDLPGNV